MSYLTDKEKRLLFSALSRERVICQQLDDSSDTQKERVQLVPIVESLERKFYYDRFEKEIRNKVIDEFAEKLKPEIFTKIKGWTNSDDLIRWCGNTIDEIAEQMKEVEGKNPITYSDTNRADCPTCGATVRGISKPFGKYCSRCGQKLDWGEEDER